jgi:hypothetical protein
VRWWLLVCAGGCWWLLVAAGGCWWLLVAAGSVPLRGGTEPESAVNVNKPFVLA